MNTDNKPKRPRKPLQALKITNHTKVPTEGQNSLSDEVRLSKGANSAYQGTDFNNRCTDEYGYWEQIRRR